MARGGARGSHAEKVDRCSYVAYPFVPPGHTFRPRRGAPWQSLILRLHGVLDFVVESLHNRGYPPTRREIGNHLGLRSTNGVNDHLRALERKGYLTREDMKSRTLRPTPDLMRAT